MQKRHWLWLLCAGGVFLIGVALWSYLSPSNYHREPYTDQFSHEFERSADLQQDLKAMWKTQPLGGTPDPSHGPNPRASTKTAIDAASRVFNTVEFVGKSKEDVIAILGDPRSSNDSIYNFPFWPAPEGAMVYRFDCGSFGWQFNVILNRDGKALEVRRAWIH